MQAGEVTMLELSKVTKQIEDMGQELAERTQRHERMLPEARRLRKRFARDQEHLTALADSPAGTEANCARPAHEPLDASLPAPEPPLQATVLAADGSQIYPDLHGWAQYYLINVGSLVYRHGSGQAPVAASEPRVAQATDAEGNLLSAELINARRDVAEMEKLADLAEGKGGDWPVVAFLDSTLGLRTWSRSIPQEEQVVLQQRYAAHLQRLRRSGAALAGVVSRSRRSGLVALLDLAEIEESGSVRAGSSPYLGLTDSRLWGDLPPGARSALLSDGDTQPVYSFYLNTEPPDSPLPAGAEAEPARIEVPEWVALDPEKLSWVHSLVYDQCRINDGYPYALSRADELAIILHEEREVLDAMLLQAMIRQGLTLPRLSPKERQKRVARAPFRRRQ
jgi:hypothetical protein